MEGRFKKEETYVYLWLIHVDVYRNQHNIVRQLASNKKNLKKNIKLKYGYFHTLFFNKTNSILPMS